MRRFASGDRLQSRDDIGGAAEIQSPKKEHKQDCRCYVTRFAEINLCGLACGSDVRFRRAFYDANREIGVPRKFAATLRELRTKGNSRGARLKLAARESKERTQAGLPMLPCADRWYVPTNSYSVIID